MSEVVKSIQINISTDTSSAEKSIDSIKSKLEALKGIANSKTNSFKFNVSDATINNLTRLSLIDSKRIDRLASSLSLLSSSGKMPSLGGFTRGVANLSGVMDQIGVENVDKIEKLGNAFGKFTNVKFPSIPKSFLQGLTNIHDAISQITDEDISRIEQLGNSAQGLSGINLQGISSIASMPADPMDAMISQMEGVENVSAAVGYAISSNMGTAFESVSIWAKTCFYFVTTGFSWIKTAVKASFSGIGKIISTSIGAVASKVSGVKKKIDKLLLSFGRIAFYRAIRRAIQLITQAFQEGVKNIYAYSNAVGTSLAPNLDSMSSNLMQMKNAIGSAVAPLINALTPAINTVINAVTILCDKLAQLFSLLGGSATYSKAIKTQYSFGDAIGATGNAAGGAKSQMDKFTAGIDELNVIDDSSSSGSGGSSSYDATTAFEEATASFGQGFIDLIQNGRWEEAGTMIAEKINDAFASIDFAELGKTIGEKIQNALEFASGFLHNLDTFSIGADIATLINNAINEIEFYLAGDVWVQKFNKLIQLISGFAQTIEWSSIGTKIGQFINGALENFDATELGKGLSAVAKGIFDMLAKALEETDWTQIGKKLSEFFVNIDWAGVVKSFFELLGAAFGAAGELIGGVIEIIAEGWQSMWESILCPYMDENGTLTIEGFLEGMKNALSNVWDWIKTNIFEPFISGFKSAFGIASPSKEMETQGGYIIEGLWLGIKNAWHSIPEYFKQKLDELKADIKEQWESMKKDANDKWQEVSENLLGKWITIKANVLTKVSEIKLDLLSTWINIKNEVDSKWNEIKNLFINAWTGMKDGIRTPINDILGFVEKFANGVIDGVNKVINAVNSFCGVSFDIPEFLQDEFKGATEFKLGIHLTPLENIKIQGLENGGFTDADLFYANENGIPEMVGRIGSRTAVANNGQIIEGIASGVTLANGGVESLLEQLIDVVDGKNFSVSIGAKEIGQANEEYTRTRGVYVNRGVFANAY